jgi:hypothetical protein
LGWGGLGMRNKLGRSILGETRPPTLALPHEGGGDHKGFCARVLLRVQRHCGFAGLRVGAKNCANEPKVNWCRLRGPASRGQKLR